jgi:hypothetical protein
MAGVYLHALQEELKCGSKCERTWTLLQLDNHLIHTSNIHSLRCVNYEDTDELGPDEGDPGFSLKGIFIS